MENMEELLVKYHEIELRKDFIIFNDDRFIIEFIKVDVPHTTLAGPPWIYGPAFEKGEVNLIIVNSKTRMRWDIVVPLDYNFKVFREV